MLLDAYKLENVIIKCEDGSAEAIQSGSHVSRTFGDEIEQFSTRYAFFNYPFPCFFNQASKHSNPDGFYYVLICLFVSTMLIYCSHATHTVRSMEMNAEGVYDSLWYKLPQKQQADVHLLLLYAQQEREIRGYGYVHCSMQMFLTAS